MKYNKEKSCGEEEKSKYSNPSCSATHSTSQKVSFVSSLVCFRCKKPYSKGHEKNSRF